MFKNKSLAVTLLLSSLPVLAFLLLPAQSDPLSAYKSGSSLLSNKFGEELLTDEARRYRKEPVPLEIAEEMDVEFEPSSSTHLAKNTHLEKTTQGALPQESAEQSDDSDSPAKKSNLDELTTVLNVNDADIEALIKTFSKLTGRNYIVDSSVKGKITIHLPTPISLSEALKVFDSVLLLRGFATVPVSENIWKVISAKEAKQTTIPLIGSIDTTDESLVTEIIKTTHLSADEIQKLVSQFISKDGYSQSVSGTNLIILVDSSSNIKRIKNLMSEIDIAPVDQDITIIPIEHALADDLAEKINKIIGGGENEKKEVPNELNIASLALRNRIAQRAGMTTQTNQPEQSSSAVRSNPIKIIPDERTNSLIVVADEFTTLKIKALVEQLDSELDKSSGRFWVYRLEHADAQELAMVLSNLISGGGAMGGMGGETRGSSMSRNSSLGNQSGGGVGGFGGGMGAGGFGGGMGASGMGSMGGGSRSRGGVSRQRNQGGNNMGGSIGIPAGGSMNSPMIPGASNSTRVTFQDEISIAADFSTNSLVINADKADYEKLLQVIKVLDVKRRQVLVEATILEVSLSEDQGLGVELHGTAATNSSGIFGQTNYGGLTNLLTNPAALSDLTIAAASAGTLTLPGGIVIPSQSALITAVSSNSNVNVLSAPTILSTDNQEAEIIVGENVPFVTSTGVNQINLGNTFNQIQRQDVGITLRITPQIGSGDFLSLQIFVEISNVVPGTRNDPNGPTTTIRTSDTVVAVKNRQMIVTGGLIQDSVTESTRGVPFLQDIPVMGALFKRQDEIKRRTNLLIFLTPQIIQDQFDAREHTKIKSDKMSSEIDLKGREPSRKDVFENPAIDDVFDSPEEEKYLENRPIRPAQSTSDSHVINTGNSYSFKVMRQDTPEPKLPDTSHLFVVLKSTQKASGSDLIMGSDGTFGLIIPRTAHSKTGYSRAGHSGNLFSTGSQYSREGDQFVCIGVYDAQEEAHRVHSNSIIWNQIDEEEMASLEKNGWVFYDR